MLIHPLLPDEPQKLIVGFGEASVFWKGVGRTIVRVSAVKLGIRGSDGEMKERREEFSHLQYTVLLFISEPWK